MSDFGYLEQDDERPCGGCGQEDSTRRCMGCFHFFNQGDEWVFNYGSIADVLTVSHNGPWVTITARSHYDGKEYTKRKRASTPIVARWPQRAQP